MAKGYENTEQLTENKTKKSQKLTAITAISNRTLHSIYQYANSWKLHLNNSKPIMTPAFKTNELRILKSHYAILKKNQYSVTEGTL